MDLDIMTTNTGCLPAAVSRMQLGSKASIFRCVCALHPFNSLKKIKQNNVDIWP
jgi:hypothetical protein